MDCTTEFRSRLAGVAVDNPAQVPRLVEAILEAAQVARASDVHLVPTADALKMHWRIDGLLRSVESLPRAIAANVAARLKVLADLLTYRTEIPQEGRIRGGDQQIEMRVSTFPTLYGEKVVVRLFVGSGQYRRLADLGLPGDVASRLETLLQERGGLLLITGPAGSGKTTTAYAALRELAAGEAALGVGGGASTGGRSLASIEDPIEAVLAGVSQSQVQPAAGFSYETGLRSLLRQDPDVLLVGEIRDRTTAELVFQASLSGHLVISTYHAGTAAGALLRLMEMGLERYQLRSGLLAVLSQRLLRRLCACATPSRDAADRLGLDVENVRLPGRCEVCRGTGYRGRLLLVEMQDRRQIDNWDGAAPRATSTLVERGLQAIESGVTSPAEFRRIFGFESGGQSAEKLPT